MIEPALPRNEAARLEALRGINILDTPPEERFDRITRIAAALFDVPIALVSLVDAERQWFKSHHGLDALETRRAISFCGHAILQDGVFHVADAAKDARFKDNPLVTGAPNIRFYAGLPLHVGGEAIGTLCLIDSKPRDFDAADRMKLDGLARWVEQTLAHSEGAAAPRQVDHWWLGIVLTALMIGLFEFLSSRLFTIPNPPAFLVIAVVFAAFHGGLKAGLASALIAWLYFAHFFSIPGLPFRYDGDNLTRVLIWALATPAIAVMTGLLQRRSARLFQVETAHAVMDAHLTGRGAAITELRESHEQLRLITENAPIQIAYYDQQMRCRYANAAFALRVGQPAEQIIGKHARDIIGAQAFAEVEPMMSRALTGERVQFERMHRFRDGRTVHLETTLIPDAANQEPASGHDAGFNDVTDQAPQRAGYYAFFNDITERKQVEQELVRSKDRLALALAGSNLSLWDFNCQSGEIYLDQVWARMLGEEPGETITTVEKLFALTHPDDVERVLEVSLMELKGKTNGYAEEHRVKTRSGEWIWIASSGKVVERAADGKALRVIGTNADITARKRAEARIEDLATRDPLTALPNRRVLADRLAHGMLTAEREDQAFFALLFIDLDRFKTINDSLGHNTGDQLLKQVAERLGGAMRKGDTLARLGGDEFALVLERLHQAEDAGPVARKIIDVCAAPYSVEGHTLNISCSIGISVFPGDAGDAETLLRNADLAMYSAKEGGRNTYRYFSQEMNQRAVEKLALERALRAAVQDGQFELYYQPKFSLRSGQLTGMEALLRWQHPQQGLISPVRFIPIAEETRLILPLGNWVLRRACAQAMEWTRRGHGPLAVAVNLSVVQFNPDLVTSVADALRDSGLEPQRLEIEITENVLMRDADENIEILRQISDLGVRIAIDDFGTGYSSLSYLRYFKLDTIKIDQSFVRNMVAKTHEASIVRAIIALAHSLQMNVVAEGVELAEQKDALGDMGCDEWQGFLNCEPLAAAGFEQRFFLRSPVPSSVA